MLSDNAELTDKPDQLGTSALLAQHLALMEELDSPPLIEGNDVQLLIDGPQTYEAMFNAIANAHDHVHLETFVFAEDKIGHKLRELLLRKRAEGLAIRLLYDSVGSMETADHFFNQFREGGIEVREFNPVNPVEGRNWEINDRDHRKILIVDGHIAFTGGVNISNVYSNGSSGSTSRSESEENGWRDTHLQIRGPAVAAFQRLFLKAWESQGEPAQVIDGLFPGLSAIDDKQLRIIASSPEHETNLIYREFLSAVRHAKRSIQITMAYFVPDQTMLDALCETAQRGVNVELILPGFTDSDLTFYAGRSFYTRLLKSGIKLYERQDALLHAKTVVIDKVWSFVGSMNMDMRSFLHNYEVIAVVLGESFGKDMQKMFMHDRKLSTPVELAEWQQRSFWQRIQEWFARWWRYWL